MYAWGGDTSGWKKPGTYNFDSAKKPYLDKLGKDADKKGPRTYTRRHEPDMKLVDPKGKTIFSESKNPLVVAVDVTGSMASWPGEIFDRLPLLYQTLSQYRDDLEISFAAIGDATCDNYPLQVNEFAKGLDLEDHIKAICPEGGGGGQVSETYELFAYFMDKHCNTPNATSPFLLIYGDEKFYNNVDPKQVEHYLGDKLEGPLKSDNVWKNILQKFNLYLLHKPYGHDSSIDKEITGHWAKAIGRQRIIELPSYDRAVDVAIGLIAKQWGEYSDFKDSLSARHSKDYVKDAVYNSLRFVDEDKSMKSVLMDKKTKSKTMSLKALVKKT